MKVLANLTPQQFLEILLTTYTKGQEKEINAKELIEQIRQQFLSKPGDGH